ncbi:MAG: hypothetical protein JRI23_34500 [Deltaproteobacteria bacterium]|nr:hypothetical protein [Deltaproteobacteria bacterium]MBW2537410.1 hypothetical protein [Deltaproteobacteria bacterium]
MAIAAEAVPEGTSDSESIDPAEAMKKECADAYLASQRLRKEGKLIAARGQLLLCARDQCPAVVKPDCVQWLSEVEAAIPTVVFAAKGRDGSDTSTVRVWLDGELFSKQLDGKPVPLDPGVHQVRFELVDSAAGVAAKEQEIVVRQGEKNRLVSISFARPSAAPSAPAPGDEHRPKPDDRGAPVAAIVIGSVGVVGLGVFAILAALGTSELDDLRSTCGQTSTCDPADVDAARNKLIGADVSLGIGIAGVAVGTGLLLYHYLGSSEEQTAFRWGVVPASGGAYGQVGWSW